jgi:hypothetical protein
MTQDLSRFQCIEMAIFNSASFSGGSTYNIMNGPSQYQIYTGTGFQYDIKVLKMYNQSTVGVIISFMQTVNGSNAVVNVPQDYIPAGGTFILDLQANHGDNSAYGSGTLNGAAGQVVWGNASAGTGNIYIIGYR